MQILKKVKYLKFKHIKIKEMLLNKIKMIIKKL